MRAILTHKQTETFRNTRGHSILLFLTDRCPVGCSHCSVNSLPNSPSIEDFELFEQILQVLTSREELELVGISGGEPFVERRGLERAIEVFSKAEKHVVVYTSGVWAKSTIPNWIQKILGIVSCIYLSTDQYHRDSLQTSQFLSAVEAIVEAGSWLVVQTIDRNDELEVLISLLKLTLGNNWEKYAEINVIPLLNYGRATKFAFPPSTKRPGSSFNKCKLINTPVVRYDGTVSACCNERVIMGQGPANLRYKCSSDEELLDALDFLQKNPLNRVISQIGMQTLVSLPTFAALSNEGFSSICDICWTVQERFSSNEESCLSILNTISNLGEASK